MSRNINRAAKPIRAIAAILMTLLSATAVAGTGHAKGPAIQFRYTTYDYKNIAQGSAGVCYFVYTNTGDAPLVLSSVATSCGCTTPFWPRKPLLPGKSARIKVVYNTSHLGEFRKVVSVKSNAANSPSAVLRIKGKVVAAKAQN